MFRSPPQLMWDITIHPPSRPSVLASTRSFLISMWEPHQIHLLLGPSILTGTPPRAYLHSGNNLLIDILSGVWLSSLGFPFQASPQDLKTRMLVRDFHTLIKGVSFSYPTNEEHHTNNSEVIYLISLGRNY